MTKVRFHGPIAGLSGAMGEMIFADHKQADKTIAYMKKPSVPSQAQLNQRARFTEAAAHAAVALANPDTRDVYAQIARKRKSTLQAVAIADFLNHPSIKLLDLSNYKGRASDSIVIRAVDDIGLADLQVRILAQDGTPIESGKAVERGIHSGKWIYTATAQVATGSDLCIEVVGVDHAGTTAQMTENATIGVVSRD
jgi:hypothetical protein